MKSAYSYGTHGIPEMSVVMTRLWTWWTLTRPDPENKNLLTLRGATKAKSLKKCIKNKYV